MLYDCDDRGFEVHYYPLSDCSLPSTAKLLQILAEIKATSKAAGRKVCLQSPNGVGKACMGMCNTLCSKTYVHLELTVVFDLPRLLVRIV